MAVQQGQAVVAVVRLRKMIFWLDTINTIKKNAAKNTFLNI